MNQRTFRRACKKVGTPRFKQKLDPEIQRIRRNHSDLQYQRRHRELNGRIARLVEDLRASDDRVYADSGDIGILCSNSHNGAHEDMVFPARMKDVTVKPLRTFTESSTISSATRVKKMVEVRLCYFQCCHPLTSLPSLTSLPLSMMCQNNDAERTSL